ncbi:hypothetical protein ACFLU8_04520 [Chloroflexota bacterium]
MLKCSNCGQKAEITKDLACRWCGYPLISKAYAMEKAKQEAIEAKRAKEVEDKAKKEAEEAAKEKTRQEAIEAKEKVKQEAIEAKRAKEVEDKAKKEAEEAAKEKTRQEAIEAKEKVKQEAIEAKRAKEVEDKAKKEAEEALRDVQDIFSEIYEGNVQLIVPRPVNSEQLRQFKEDLEWVDNLKIRWTGGSDKGTIIAVSLQKPMTLIHILNDIATVGKVDKKDEKIVVMLRNPTVI